MEGLRDDESPYIIKNYLNRLGIFFHEGIWFVLLLVVLLLFLGVTIYLLKEAPKKKRRIVQPADNLPWNQTYCSVSLDLVVAAQVTLYIQLVIKVVTLIQLLLPGDLYAKYLFVAPDFDWKKVCLMPPEQQVKYFEESRQSLHYWLFAIIEGLPLLAIITTDFIFFLQSVEWQAMSHLIESQKQRTVEEITYDHHNENIRETLAPQKDRFSLQEEASPRIVVGAQQATYRRREILMKRRFDLKKKVFLGYYLLCIPLIFLQPSVQWGMAAMYLTFATVHTGLTIHESFCFWRINRLMVKYHKFEYVRTRRSMQLQYVIMVISHLFTFAFFFAVLGLDYGNKVFCELIDDDIDNFSVEYILVQAIKAMITIIQLPSLLIAFVLIKVKSSQDILQGISKLDYLLKVSVFQIQKGRSSSQEEDRRLSVGTAHTFEKLETIGEDTLLFYTSSISSTVPLQNRF